MKIHNTEDTISEDLIREIIRAIVFAHEVVLNDNSIEYQIIKHTRCDCSDVIKIKNKMIHLGLDYCRHPIDFTIFLTWFAEMRGYMTTDEINRVWTEIGERERKEKEVSDKFCEKYGPDSKWTDEVWEEYERAI